MFKKSFLTIGLILVSVLLFSCTSVPPNTIATPETGVLILAHGGTPFWNQVVKQTVEAMACACVKEIALGMGTASTIQPAIDRLQAAHVKKIIVIPLFLSAHSELYRHLEYVLGYRKKPDKEFLARLEWRFKNPRSNDHAHEHSAYRLEDFTSQVHFSVPYTITEPLGSHPLITDILLERLLKLRLSNHLMIFMIAHGPVSEDDNRIWLNELAQHAIRINKIYPQFDFGVFTLRDDASNEIRAAIHERILKMMREEKLKSRDIIILPYLLAHGGVEHEIEMLARECSCTIQNDALLPHSNITRWLEAEFQNSMEHSMQGVENHEPH